MTMIEYRVDDANGAMEERPSIHGPVGKHALESMIGGGRASKHEGTTDGTKPLRVS
jgi:hypothetical protein